MKSHKKKLEGVGGLLLLYFILSLLGFFWTVLIIIGFITLKSYFLFFMNLLAGIIELYAIYLLLRKRKNAIRLNILTLWFGFAVELLMQISYLSSLDFNQASLINPIIYTISLIFGLMFGIAYNIAYTLYWIRSERVKNTFVK